MWPPVEVLWMLCDCIAVKSECRNAEQQFVQKIIPRHDGSEHVTAVASCTEIKCIDVECGTDK